MAASSTCLSATSAANSSASAMIPSIAGHFTPFGLLLELTRNKIEVRLLKAEQANCWRIVAATAPVKRPRIFIIRYPALAFG